MHSNRHGIAEKILIVFSEIAAGAADVHWGCALGTGTTVHSDRYGIVCIGDRYHCALDVHWGQVRDH